MLGDLRILDTGVELLLDTERVALQELFNMIRRFRIGYDVELHKRTRRARAAVADRSDRRHGRRSGRPPRGRARPPRPWSSTASACRVIRTDVGVDLLCPAEDTEALIAALEQRGAEPVDDAAAECLRIERGRPRYGIDLDDTVIPQEAGLNDRAVSFTKGCYVGQETVARLFYRGKPNRRLRGLALSAPVETGAEIEFEERTVGHVASTTVSPRLGPIALGLLRRAAAPGSTVLVGAERAPATVVELPF